MFCIDKLLGINVINEFCLKVSYKFVTVLQQIYEYRLSEQLVMMLVCYQGDHRVNKSNFLVILNKYFMIPF